MYDIEFFKNIKPLKDRIVAGKLTTRDCNYIFNEFEKLRQNEPYVFNVETTNYCNMTCVMCPRTKLMTRKNILMDDEQFLKVIEQIKPHPEEKLRVFWDFIEREYKITPTERSENSFYFHTMSKCLTLHGYGEPILDKNIVERVQLCSDRNIPTYFSCVPANITVEKAEELMKAGLSVLKFSIDATDDELLKSIRGKQSNFVKSYETILKILAIKNSKNFQTIIVPAMINLSGTEDTVKMQKEFIDMWKSKDVFAYIKSQDNRWYFEDGEDITNRSHYEQQYCEFAWTSLTVMADGSVVPCTQDYNAEMIFGNIMENSLEQVWNNDKYREFRRWHVTGDFPKGYKCSERCDLQKVYTYIK